MTLWLNEHYLDEQDTHVGPLAHALHYGTGVFEGIRAYPTASGPAVFRLEAHLERMKQGAELLGMSLDVDQLTSVIVELLQRNQLESAYIRPVAYFGAGGLRLDLDELEAHTLVATLPWTSHLSNRAGVRLGVSPYRRIAATALPPLKFTGTYVNSCVAKREAAHRGFDEALFVDSQGYVVEATGENVFLVHGDTVVAVEHPDALPGITRDTVATLAGAQRRRVHLDELLDADEVFLTGTSAEVARVGQLGSRTYDQFRLTDGLATTYQDIVHGRDRGHRCWLTAA